MFDVAKEYETLGLFPVPADVHRNSCKITAPWQSDPKSVEEWAGMFTRQNGIGIKLGVASGGLQVVDVDQKHDSTLTLSSRFMEAMKYMLPDIYQELYIEETRSGGLHVFFKRQSEVERKFVPAKTMEFSEVRGKLVEAALIEVLGEGEIVFTHPTPSYRVLQGSIEEIPTITDAQYSELIATCKSFNELPEVEVVESDFDYSKEVDPNDKRPGTIFNRKCDPHKFSEYLVSQGWKVQKKLGDKYWFTRPDKDKGTSATFNHDGRKLFVVFSSSTDFATHHSDGLRRKGHTPFSVYTRLSHNGDFRAATAMLVANGFVDPEAWDEVEPLCPVKATPFNLDELLPSGCDEFKRFVSEVAESYQVQPEMVVMPCLSIISLCLSGAARVGVSDDWKEDAPIWSIVVAEASERKSPVLGEIMEPVEAFFKDFGRKHKRDLRALMRKRGGLEARVKKLEDEYNKAILKNEDVSAIEASISLTESDLEDLPEITDLPNLLQSDITAEALVKQLKTNGEVCGVVSSEADPIEVALGLYSDKPNFSIYLKGFSVERYTANRVGGGETVLEQPRIVLSVMMQPEPMEKLAESRVARKRGFLARCFFAVPSSKVGSRNLEPEPISGLSREWWEGKIRGLLSMPHRLRFHDNGGEVSFCTDDPRIVKLSPEAYAILMKARERNEAGLGTGGDYDDDSGWGGKLMGNICRLGMTLHFLSGHTERDEIGEEVMQAACAWVDPLTEHFCCACGEVGEMSIDKRVHAAIRKMKGHVDDGMSVNAVVQAIKTRRHKNAKDWQPVWDRMIELGFIRIVDGEKPKRGPAPRIMRLHPNFFNLAGK